MTAALKFNDEIKWQAGWGNNGNSLVSFGIITDPPTNGFFLYGSGGGPSAVYSKPSFQQKLHGTQRLLPDISWLADPYTGGVIAIRWSDPRVLLFLGFRAAGQDERQ